MHIKRIQLYDVKPHRRNIPEEGELSKAAQKRLLLQGGNGSGKTTVLETIQKLWEFFGDWIERGDGNGPLAKHYNHYLAQSKMAAVEFGDFPVVGDSLWIGMGGGNEWEDLKKQNPHSNFAGCIRYGRNANESKIELPKGIDWKTLRNRSLVGSELQPNIVHFEPDNRNVSIPNRSGPQLLDTTKLNWAAVYDPNAIDIESLLLTLKARDQSKFEACRSLINAALSHGNKELTDFGEDTRLMVTGRNQIVGQSIAYQHTLESLSSGERQMLLMIAYTFATLRPGGIVLIDEPDLHIHISMITQLLQTIENIASDRNGQLIVASHSQWVWDWFSRDSEKIELTPWRGDE